MVSLTLRPEKGKRGKRTGRKNMHNLCFKKFYVMRHLDELDPLYDPILDPGASKQEKGIVQYPKL